LSAGLLAKPPSPDRGFGKQRSNEDQGISGTTEDCVVVGANQSLARTF